MKRKTISNLLAAMRLSCAWTGRAFNGMSRSWAAPWGCLCLFNFPMVSGQHVAYSNHYLSLFFLGSPELSPEMVSVSGLAENLF